jgi:hypothetical protein
MLRALSFLLIIELIGLTTYGPLSRAKASWRSSFLMGENSGICKNGSHRGNVNQCPENQKGRAARRRPRKRRPH